MTPNDPREHLSPSHLHRAQLSKGIVDSNSMPGIVAGTVMMTKVAFLTLGSKRMGHVPRGLLKNMIASGVLYAGHPRT